MPPQFEDTSQSTRSEDHVRQRSDAAKEARKSLSLPIFDGTCSFKGFRKELERYFEYTEQPRHLEAALLLESMKKGNKQAKDFYQEMVDSDQTYERYSTMINKAEEFFAKTTTTFEYFQKLSIMKQLKYESLQDWYSRVLKIQQEAINSVKCESIHTIKIFAIETFINGLSDSQLRWEVRREVKDPSEKTLRDLLNFADRMSEALKHHRSLDQSNEEIEIKHAHERNSYEIEDNSLPLKTNLHNPDF